MQTLKGAASIAAKTRWHGPRASHFAITAGEYTALGRFSNATDKLGLKITGITKGPFGAGARLQMSGRGNYEVDLTGGQVLLGRVEASGKRVRICEASSTPAGFEKLLAALKHSEGRLP
jgi:hypothetical protein